MCGIAALTLMTANIQVDAASRVNPLTIKSTAPYEALPFDKIQSDDYRDAVLKGLSLYEKQIDEIAENKKKPTFENTIVALDRAGEEMNYAILALSNVEHATGDQTLMDIMAEVTPAITEATTKVTLNEKLFARISEVYKNRDKIKGLTPEQKRLITETYDDFARSGAALKGEDRKKLAELNQKLSDLSIKFSQNVTNDMKNPSRRLFVTADKLEGFPQTIIDAARAEAAEALKAEGKEDDGSLYMFSVFQPSYTPFMKYQRDRELRKQMYRLYNTRNYGGEFDNVPVLREIANTRLEVAKLLGKENFGEQRLQHTMAGSVKGVMDMLNELREAYASPAKRELVFIEDYARKYEGPEFNLEAWDYSFWSDKLKNEKYAFNDEDLKPYFELNNTIDGVFGLATKLYGYTFKENKDIPGYHPDVRTYEVYDRDGKLLGLLYTDFYFRSGKAPGAWMTEFRGETKDDKGNREIPFISIVCNFSKPVGDQPVLLTPYEVETFLHEFGHALHGLSSQATYASLSGTNVYHDFVELFSQFNENYLTQKEYLDGFARHYQTGEPIPQELLDRFIKASQYGAAYACMRQLGFGFLDMAYHTITEPLPEDIDIEAFETKAQDPVRVFPALEGTLMSPSFGHIFSGGYASGYYGYKWSEELEADAFSAFLENGIFDPVTADKFHKMLESGGTVDPMELYIEFRGKRPTVDALLKRDGIKK